MRIKPFVSSDILNRILAEHLLRNVYSGVYELLSSLEAPKNEAIGPI
jgi:hypothetical protein